MANYKHEKKPLCAYSSKLIPAPEAPLADSTCKMYSQKTIYSAFSRMDLVYFIPGSSGNNWGGERIGFEDECMNSPYKYHKPIEPSEEWSESYIWGVCIESKTVLNLPVSNLSHRVASQLNNISDYHWAMRPFTRFLSEPKLRYPCSPNIFSLGTFIWPSSSHLYSFKKKNSYAITDPIPMHTNMHTHILDQEKFLCLFN